MKLAVIYGTKGQVTEQHICYDETERQEKIAALKRRGMKVEAGFFSEPKWLFMSNKQRSDLLGKLPWPGDSTDVKRA